MPAVEMTLEEQFDLLTELNKRNLARISALESELSQARKEIEAMESVHTAAALWMEYVEKNGGDYLPEHAQWIKTALLSVDRLRAGGKANG